VRSIQNELKLKRKGFKNKTINNKRKEVKHENLETTGIAVKAVRRL